MIEKFYVMHHAPISKRKGEIVGSKTDIGLSKYGIEVAKHQAERIRRMLGSSVLNNVGNQIISSPLKRAVQTAEIVAEKCNMDIVLDNRLMAQNFGQLDGMTIDEINNDDELKLNFWDYIKPEERDNHHAPNAESNYEMVTRVNDFKLDVLQQYQEISPLVITHGTVIDSLIATINNMRLDQVEGSNRKYEGRPIEISLNSYSAIGISGEQFNFIPGIEDVLKRGNIDEIKSYISNYIYNDCEVEDEKIHLEKLLKFL